MNANTMKAIVYSEFGPPDVLRLEEVARPEPKRGEILVRVRATSVNFGDIMGRSFRSVTPRGFNMPLVFWLFAKMAMGWRKPKMRILGNEFAGEVAAVGEDVTRFKPGDEVFGQTGQSFGAYAEFLSLSEKAPVVRKPANLSWAEAAVIPYGAVHALSILRRAKLQPGQRILVNGASGGIGAAAVQIAKHLGAEVTGVCGAARLDYVLALGADRVIDYAKEDFTQSGETYDVVFDILGLTPFSRARHALAPRGLMLYASFKMRHLLAMMRTSLIRGRRVICAIAPGSLEDMLAVKELVEAGKLKAIVDRSFPLDQAAEAHRYVETGERKGSVAITVGARPPRSPSGLT